MDFATLLRTNSNRASPRPPPVDLTDLSKPQLNLTLTSEAEGSFVCWVTGTSFLASFKLLPFRLLTFRYADWHDDLKFSLDIAVVT